MKLKGKNAVVTGASSGIGEAIARRMSAEGAFVTLCDIDEKVGKSVVESIHLQQGASEFYSLDVSQEQQFKDMFKLVGKKHGPIDIVVNNAGVGKAGTVINQSEEDWDLMMNVNAKGTFYGCKYGILHMIKENKKGSIINIASVAGMVGVLNRLGYCASKAAVVGLTKSAASDFADREIRVNAISPGTIESPWIKKILSDHEDPVKAREQMKQRQPIGRMGTPEEVAHLALFLASDESSFITGSNYVADGGLTVR